MKTENSNERATDAYWKKFFAQRPELREQWEKSPPLDIPTPARMGKKLVMKPRPKAIKGDLDDFGGGIDE